MPYLSRTLRHLRTQRSWFFNKAFYFAATVIYMSMIFYFEYSTHESLRQYVGDIWTVVFVIASCAVALWFFERFLAEAKAGWEAVPIQRSVSRLDEAIHDCSFKCNTRAIAVIQGGEKPQLVCDLHLVQCLLAEPALEAELVASLAIKFAEQATVLPSETTVPVTKHLTFGKIIWAIVIAQVIFLGIFAVLWKVGLGKWFLYR